MILMSKDQILILILEKANIQIMPTSLNIFNHSKIAIKSTVFIHGMPNDSESIKWRNSDPFCRFRVIWHSMKKDSHCNNRHLYFLFCNSNAVVFSSPDLRNIWRSVMNHHWWSTTLKNSYWLSSTVMSNKFVSIIRIRVIVCLGESSPIYFPKRFWLFYK